VNGLQVVPVRAAIGAVGINFVGNSTTPMGTSETAGVVNASHWNNAAGAARSTPLALVDAAGAASGATVTWTASTAWTTPISDLAGNRRLMKGYLDTTSSSATTVTVAGLAARAYDVYVYADGDNRSYARTGSYTISGPGITASTTTLTDAAGVNFTGTFTRASNSIGNYVKFTVTTDGFTITARPSSADSTTLRAPINAIQIVSAGGSQAP
jgi:hypothetical protein